MNWWTKFLNFVSKARNEVLGVTATVGAVSGAVAGLALTPIGGLIPLAVIGLATKISAASATAAIIAAKVLPGNGENRSVNAAPGVDPETPKAPR